MSILWHCGQVCIQETANTEDTGRSGKLSLQRDVLCVLSTLFILFCLGAPLWWEQQTKHKFPQLAVEWAHMTASSFHLPEFYAMHEVCDVTLDWPCETARLVSIFLRLYILFGFSGSQWLALSVLQKGMQEFFFFRLLYFPVYTRSTGENFDRKVRFAPAAYFAHKIFIRCTPRKILYHCTKKLVSYGNRH